MLFWVLIAVAASGLVQFRVDASPSNWRRWNRKDSRILTGGLRMYSIGPQAVTVQQPHRRTPKALRRVKIPQLYPLCTWYRRAVYRTDSDSVQRPASGNHLPHPQTARRSSPATCLPDRPTVRRLRGGTYQAETVPVYGPVQVFLARTHMKKLALASCLGSIIN
jgi:hypothetical protein